MDDKWNGLVEVLERHEFEPRHIVELLTDTLSMRDFNFIGAEYYVPKRACRYRSVVEELNQWLPSAYRDHEMYAENE